MSRDYIQDPADVAAWSLRGIRDALERIADKLTQADDPESIDMAWARVVAALPDDYRLHDLVCRAVDGPRAWRAIASRWIPFAERGTEIAGVGPTPAAALLDLAVRVGEREAAR